MFDGRGCHTADLVRCTSRTFVVLQCKLVSG